MNNEDLISIWIEIIEAIETQTNANFHEIANSTAPTKKNANCELTKTSKQYDWANKMVKS